MKRIAALILLLCLLAAAACGEGALRGYEKENGYVYVTLGRYPQSIDGGDPEEDNNTWKWASTKIADPSSVTVHTDPLLWRVLTVDEEKAYLCSEYVLFAMPMHTNVNEYKTIGGDFGQTDLSRYLNGTFAAEAFTPEELAMLLPCETYGKVFLLDAEDVKNKGIGMGRELKKGLKAWATEYAVRITGAYVFKIQYGAHSAYWVRNQSTTDRRHARCTKDGGQLGHIISDRENEGVRPAVYLSLDAFEIRGGTGTKTDPYVLGPKGEAAGEGEEP